MNVKDLFEKYCSKYSETEYESHDHLVTLDPATNEEIRDFRKHCDSHNVDKKVADELETYYRQSNSFFNYFTCDDEMLFEWWDEGLIWLGNVDDDCFVYNAKTHRYAIGFAGDSSLGEYDTVMDMIQAYLVEGQEYDNN